MAIRQIKRSKVPIQTASDRVTVSCSSRSVFQDLTSLLKTAGPAVSNAVMQPTQRDAMANDPTQVASGNTVVDAAIQVDSGHTVADAAIQVDSDHTVAEASTEISRGQGVTNASGQSAGNEAEVR